MFLHAFYLLAHLSADPQGVYSEINFCKHSQYGFKADQGVDLQKKETNMSFSKSFCH